MTADGGKVCPHPPLRRHLPPRGEGLGGRLKGER
nr:MAG TPA: hypothetical protein [Caudoviricetes sp.]